MSENVRVGLLAKKVVRFFFRHASFKNILVCYFFFFLLSLKSFPVISTHWLDLEGGQKKRCFFLVFSSFVSFYCTPYSYLTLMHLRLFYILLCTESILMAKFLTTRQNLACFIFFILLFTFGLKDERVKRRLKYLGLFLYSVILLIVALVIYLL